MIELRLTQDDECRHRNHRDGGVAYARRRQQQQARQATLAGSAQSGRSANRNSLVADRRRRRRPDDRIYTHGGRRPCGLRGLCRSGRRLRMALRRRDLRHRHAGDAGLPGGRHLPGAGLPRLRKAVFPARVRVVGRFPARDQRDVLRQGRSGVLARVARHVLRRRSDRAGRFPARAVSPGAPMDARGPARPPHRGGRRRRTRQCADQIARVAERFRRPHRRHVRRSGRRSLPRLGCGPSEAGHRGRSCRVRTPHPRRSGDLLAADLGRGPHSADAQEAVGASGRHPACRAFEQAAVPAARLFLYRQRPGARHRRQADHRLGRGDEVAVRQDRRLACC